MKASLVLALFGACTQPALAVVQFPFARRASPPPRGVASRASKPRAVNAETFLGAMTYVVNATIGTPGQPVSLVLSSSTSETWVIDTRSSDCTYSSSYYSGSYDGTTDSDSDYSYSTECIWGSFSPNVSSTFSYESEYAESSSSDSYSSSYSYDFSNYYPDGSYAQGRYFSDVITLGDVSFDNFTVGLVNYTNRYIGVLGLGYNDSSHSTFVDRLAAQELINSSAYSIWVDDAQANSGNILFGAIDTTKFEGNLSRLSSSYSGAKMMMSISSINATAKDSTDPISITYNEEDDTTYYGSSSGGSSSSSYSGSSYSDYMFSAIFSPPDPVSVLPDDVTAQMWEIGGAYYDTSAGMALIGCNAGGDASTTFSLRLGKGQNGPNISVALEDLIIPVTDVDLETYSSLSSYLDPDTCIFGVQNTSYGYSYSSGYTLGGSLLRRTYSVFDFANDEIAIAPVKFDATETSNIVAFATYGSVAPSSSMDCTSSYCSRTSSDGTSTNSDGSSRDGDGDGEDDGIGAGILTAPALIGLALGVGLGSLSLGIVGFLFWRHRRNRRLAAHSKDAGASVYSAEAGESATAAPPQGPTTAGAAPGPEMSQASPQQQQAVPPGSARGKAPEIPMPENLASSSSHGHGDGVHGSEPAAASSSRNA